MAQAPKLNFNSSKQIRDKFKEQTIKEMETSGDSLRIEDGIKIFLELISDGKLEFRAYPHATIHSKVYISRFNEDDRDYGRVITGSSNFSASGLRDNLEFNVELKNHSDVKFALDKFEDLWEKSIDITEDYVDTIREKTWMNPSITPYEIFLKVLYEWFGDDLDVGEIAEDAYLPDGFRKLNYQVQAVSTALKILDAYNGVFLSDVVGLGKTYVSALLARELGGKKLVVCPPVLKEYWEDTFMDFGVRSATVVSHGKLDHIINKGNYYYSSVSSLCMEPLVNYDVNQILFVSLSLMIWFDLVSIKPCNLILHMRIVHAILISVTLLGCDSGVHVENRHDSISASINAAQQFYNDYHKHNSPLTEDSTEVLVLAEMVRQYPPDWTKAVAWSDGQGGMYVATIIGRDKPSRSFSHPDISVLRIVLVEIGLDGIVTASRVLKFMSTDSLDQTRIQYYVNQWQSGKYETPRVLVAEFTLGLEPQVSQSSMPLDRQQIPADLSLREITKQGKVENDWYWCWISDSTRGGWVCFGGADGCKWIPAEIEISCICASICNEDEGGNTGGSEGSNPPVGSSGDGGGSKDVKNVDEKEKEECTCSNQTVCDMIKEYKDLNVGFTPSCSDFRTIGSTKNFSWNEFMGNWANGNEYGKHRPYGIMDQSVMNRVQQLRDSMNAPVVLTSGYRCPAGNRAVGGKMNSQHMHGTAVDIRTGCDRKLFNKLANKAKLLGFQHTKWGTYPDCHLHIENE